MMQAWTGTSGFQYPAWKGVFYPEKLPVSKMLPYYATQFPSTEINYSFRQIPSAKTISAWAAATPEEFKFSFKAPQKVTHFAKLRHSEGTVAALHEAIAPLGAKLGLVLFQLPATFKKDAPLLEDFLGGLPAGLKAAFEFRDASWLDDEVYAVLKAHNTALCIAESEEFETPAEVTADFGCLRLRREDYTPAQVKKWAAWVRGQKRHWGDAFVYFKHEDTGIGTAFAKQFLAAMAG
ncbi:MAG: hypothetical protein JWO94_332 [Verrucomicrobiaceae bacterium]|nr:hypothetical protein [Verrucomicrobiaceae bacterium]